MTEIVVPVDPWSRPVPNHMAIHATRQDYLTKLPDKFLASEVDGELILIHGDSGQFFSIDNVGFEIWNLIDRKMSLEEMTDALLEQYDVPASECDQAVRRFAEELVDAGFARLGTEI